MHRQILSAGYTVMFDSMPPDNERIYIPKGQLSAIATFKYYDVDGDIQTWDSSNYQINTLAQPGYVMPVENGNYPSVQASTWNAVQIAFNCGWATTADVPEDLLHAVKLAISHLFENRDMSPVIGASALNVKMPQAVHSLLDIYSLREFA